MVSLVRTRVQQMPPPTFMDPAAAAHILKASLAAPEKPRTIADAATQSGLALRDAERGLHWLTREYRGHLRVTEEGDLLFVFPTGFTKPWQTRDAFARALAWTGRVLAGAMRFVVRAWLMIALLAYAGIFLALLIGLTFARSSSNDDRGPNVGDLLAVVFRVVIDALFWTFHPFSPFAIDRYGEQRMGMGRAPSRGKKDETPFYEKINRFFFGPTQAPEDPRATMQRVLAEIRAQKGRIGLHDVMRVTGLPREEADPLMARLMLDYDGDVVVSEEGGITYRFPDVRRTAVEGVQTRRPEPAWARPAKLLPLTGNSFETNVLIVGLNFFNAVMATVAIEKSLTIANIKLMMQGFPVDLLPKDVPIALGVVPLVFSIGLMAIPIGRALLRPIRAREVARHNGRLAVLREVLAHARTKGAPPVTETKLAAAWSRAVGAPPEPKELTRVVVEYGGDVDVNATDERGEIRYRFADLEVEAAALEAEREQADAAEARVGKVVFASDTSN